MRDACLFVVVQNYEWLILVSDMLRSITSVMSGVLATVSNQLYGCCNRYSFFTVVFFYCLSINSCIPKSRSACHNQKVIVNINEK